MDVRFIAAALSEPLGAPNIISISNDTSVSTNGGTAGVVFKSTGGYSRYVANVLIAGTNWISPQTNMSEYEIRFTLSSGDTPAGDALDTWLALSSNRSVTLEEASIEGEATCTILAEIRWTGDNVVQDSATYTLTAVGPFA